MLLCEGQGGSPRYFDRRFPETKACVSLDIPTGDAIPRRENASRAYLDLVDRGQIRGNSARLLSAVPFPRGTSDAALPSRGGSPSQSDRYIQAKDRISSGRRAGGHR